MITVKCDHKGCGKTFSKDTAGSAEQALRMHKGRSHGGIRSVGGGRKNPALQPAEPATNGHAPEVVKRRYNKRPQEPEPVVHFCPDCGCDIQRVAVGISLARKIQVTGKLKIRA